MTWVTGLIGLDDNLIDAIMKKIISSESNVLPSSNNNDEKEDDSLEEKDATQNIDKESQ